MTMTYYFDPGSGSCRRVTAVIRHLGLEVEEVFINLLAGGNQTDEFQALNPNRMVPALVDDSQPGDPGVLWEASAIMIHLCEKAGGSSLWPEGPARMDVLRWMFWAAEHFRQPAPVYFEEKVIAGLMGKPANTARVELARLQLERFAPVLDQRLSSHRFVTGDTPTLADLDLAAPLSQMARSGVPYDGYAHIMRWSADLGEVLPAWAEAGRALEDRMQAALAG